MVRVYVDGVLGLVNMYWLTSIGGGGVSRGVAAEGGVTFRDGLRIGLAFKGLCPSDLSIIHPD